MTDPTRLSDSAEEDESRPLRRALLELEALANAFWQRYLEVGPGYMNVDDYEPIDLATARCLERLAEVDHAEIRPAIVQLRRLLHACACTPHGLCFVTGEAGLIPRRDQHQQVDEALAALRRSVTDWP